MYVTDLELSQALKDRKIIERECEDQKSVAGEQFFYAAW